MRLIPCTVAAAILAVASTASADTTPQTIPFSQDWSNADLITANDDWSGVPGIIGYRGDNLTSSTAVNAQNVVAPGTNVINVTANATDTTQINGGIYEFNLADPVVAMQGSGTADAPHLVIHLDLTGKVGAIVDFDVRDVDGGADNAIQQIAVQYRIGTTGNFINLPSGYIADATTGGSATQVTHRTVHLPAMVGGEANVQVRILTTNAPSNDEFVGIDNIVITEGSAPGAEASAQPPMQIPTGAVHLMAMAEAGSLPPSTGITVTCDATPIGGSATTTLFDDGANDDGAAGDMHFGVNTTIAAGTTAGTKTLICTVADAENRSSAAPIFLEVLAVCGDGIREGTEACDDDDTDAGDGCSATCTVEPGYSCTGNAPSVCTDIDECTANTDNCDANATCANTVGSFTCTCNGGWSGDGVTCTNVDECTLNTDNCAALATCTDTPGSFTCACTTGYGGDGTTTGTGCTDLDECTDNTDNCSDNASCTNTIGSFTCACNGGFTGDGVTCDDIDECTTNADNCDTNATCTNTPGSFTCACNGGYEGSGTTCTDVNECTTNNGGCSAFATCTNTDGGRTCACFTGYGGDGVTCAAVCGDALIVPPEDCDDDGTENDDGCSATCTEEDGWTCTGTPSECVTSCGDGVIVGAEECDDAGTDAGDGCGADCAVEEGWICKNEPSTCSEAAACGDGVIDDGEECDDGNDSSEDGCDATCVVESGFVCDEEEPTNCEPDADGDHIADSVDNCPDVANPSQFDVDDDGIGAACDEDENAANGTDSGCCSTSHDDRSLAGFGFLAMLTMLGLRRRRR
jgi:cysteine-rich repeat protein